MGDIPQGAEPENHATESEEHGAESENQGAASEAHGADFEAQLADELAGMTGVVAVALGGSRAVGEHRPDSDWDFAVYYRGEFQPEQLRRLDAQGTVSPIGGWGGGVFNGGAWLTIDGRRVDVHYRDLDDVEFRLTEAQAGRFAIERLLFHQAGIPTYIVVAELARQRVLRGDLPRPEFPAALRASAPPRWFGEAWRTLDYARSAHAERGHVTETAAAIGTAAAQAAHGILAARGEWITNEKTLLDRAALRPVDPLLANLRPTTLTPAIDATRALLHRATQPN